MSIPQGLQRTLVDESSLKGAFLACCLTCFVMPRSLPQALLHTLAMILKCTVSGSTSGTSLMVWSIVGLWLVRLESESNVSTQSSQAVKRWLSGFACLGCSKDWQAAQGHLVGGLRVSCQWIGIWCCLPWTSPTLYLRRGGL